MSGVYIKMPMPTVPQTVIIYPDGTVADVYDGEKYKAISVPDHGRLGDLEELEQAMRNRKEFYGRVSDPDCLVADAPTIIPASGKDINFPTKEEEHG